MNNPKGFSLLEVLLASTIIFVGVAAVMSIMSSTFSINLATEEQTKVTMAINAKSEWLRSLYFCDDPDDDPPEGTESAPLSGTICATFNYDPNTTSFTGQHTFDVVGLTNKNGEPAQGVITASVPGPLNNAQALIEFTINIDYYSEISSGKSSNQTNTHEKVTIWVSPDN